MATPLRNLIEHLESAGATPASPEEAEAVRLEKGQPVYGRNSWERNLPQETQLLDALHFDKGCFLGHEIVERIRSRGHVNRLLVRLHVASALRPVPGTKVLSNAQPVGEVTTSAFSPALQKVVAFGMLRATAVTRSARFTVKDAPATTAA